MLFQVRVDIRGQACRKLKIKVVAILGVGAVEMADIDATLLDYVPTQLHGRKTSKAHNRASGKHGDHQSVAIPAGRHIRIGVMLDLDSLHALDACGQQSAWRYHARSFISARPGFLCRDGKEPADQGQVGAWIHDAHRLLEVPDP